MNTSRLIWGVICLVLAAALGVLCIVLPPENLMFQIGDQNMPWIPAVVLGIVGIVLLATVGSSGQATAEAKQPAVVHNPEKVALNKRLESIGWGLFLIMLGGFALVPEQDDLRRTVVDRRRRDHAGAERHALFLPRSR